MTQISILIPAHNAAATIRETMDGCLRQGESVGEIILVDDGSIDDTSTQAEAWASQHAIPVKIIRQQNRGACHARNRAFQSAAHDWIQWLDCDDVLAPGKLEQQLQRGLSHPQSLMYSGWRKFETSIRETSFSEWDSLENEYAPEAWIESRTMGIPGCWLGHRSLFEKVGPWDERLSINQDGDYFTRAIVRADTIQVVKGTGVHYRTGHANRTSHFTPDKALSLFRSVQSFEREVARLDADLNQVVAEQYQTFIHRVYPHCREQRKEALRKVQELAEAPIPNHLLESRLSQRIAKFIGWKAFVLLRQWSWKFRTP